MYNNPYGSIYNAQANIDRINNQIAELEKMKQQIPQQPIQPTNLTQNFQIAPTNKEVIKYAGSMDEVQREMVIGDTPFFSKDMSVVWVKNTKGEVKTYELNEIVPKDDKDLLIEGLQFQIAELRKEIKGYAKSNNEYVDEPIEDEESTNISTVSKSTKKQK